MKGVREDDEEPRVVEHDSFDDIVWQQAMDASGELRKVRQEGNELRRGFGGLLGDIHAGLYKMAPRLLPEGEAPTGSRWQRESIEKTWQTTEWEQTREASVMDEVLSALGTIAAGRAALDELQKQQEEQQQKTPGGAGSPGDPGSGQGDTGDGQAPELTPQQSRALARAMRDAAGKEVERTAGAMVAWGLDPGSLTQMPLEERITLARRLVREQKLRDLGEIAGAMRALGAGIHSRRVTKKPASIVGIETGGKVGQLLPSEMAALGHPILGAEAKSRLVRGQMMQWRKAGREKQGRGPLVVLCDASGSTEGQQELLIKGLALGLLEIAKRQKRSFAGVVFSSATECKTFEFPGGRVSAEALLGFATTFFGGGTDWEAPLREGLRLQQLSPYRNGDIVLITDGLCGLPPEFREELNAEKKRRDLRVLGVLAQSGESSPAAMGFCDRVIATSDLAAAAEEIMGEMAADRN